MKKKKVKEKKKVSIRKPDKSDKKWGIRKTAEKKKRILKCLEKFSDVTEACEKVRVSRETYYHWLHNDKKFAGDVEALDKWSVDRARGRLFYLINGHKYTEVTKEHSTIWRGKGKEKIETPIIVTKEVTKEFLPHERAIRFFLTNRERKNWKERWELTGEDGEPIAVNIVKFSDVKSIAVNK